MNAKNRQLLSAIYQLMDYHHLNKFTITPTENSPYIVNYVNNRKYSIIAVEKPITVQNFEIPFSVNIVVSGNNSLYYEEYDTVLDENDWDSERLTELYYFMRDKLN